MNRFFVIKFDTLLYYDWTSDDTSFEIISSEDKLARSVNPSNSGNTINNNKDDIKPVHRRSPQT